jgi:probable rRNA maturation factor
VSLHEVSRAKIAQINLAYRGKPDPTNVIAISGNPFSREIPQWIPRNLGDVFLCPAIIKTESTELGLSFLDHLLHLVVHATLHLNGYDHQDDKSGHLMENLERKILKYMGIQDPYQTS